MRVSLQGQAVCVFCKEPITDPKKASRKKQLLDEELFEGVGYSYSHKSCEEAYCAMTLQEFNEYLKQVKIEVEPMSFRLIQRVQNACGYLGHETIVYPEKLDDARAPGLDEGDLVKANAARDEALKPFYESYQDCEHCKK